MSILVPIKAVATVEEDFELSEDGTGIDPDFLEFELNEWDSYAVEAALRVAEGTQGTEVVVVTIGDEDSEEVLRQALAMGADRALRIWDESLPPLIGPLLAARLLSGVVASVSPELVLCGAQSSDAAFGATGIALAATAGLPSAAIVREFSHDAGASTVELARELEGGSIQRMRISAPAVLTVQTGINEPRYATLRAIKQADAKPLEILSPATLGVDAASVPEPELRRVYVPEAEASATMIEGSAEEIAERISTIVGEALGA